MDNKQALEAIQKIFESASEENPILYKAYERWNNEAPNNDEAYKALEQIIHPNGGISIGMPLSYSQEVNFWRACEIIRLMILDNKVVGNWGFVEFILKNDDETKFFLGSYFRQSPRERMMDGMKSISRLITEAA